VLVEVKLWSGKSSHPDPDSPAIVDQLAREWRILLARCHLESATPHMLYVTSATRYPVTDISQAAEEFASKAGVIAGDYPLQCAWLSWASVATAFRDSPQPVLRDLSRFCERLDLTPFEGISPISPRGSLWKFSQNDTDFHFQAHPVTFHWKFA
jgi:hypothetical protein